MFCHFNKKLYFSIVFQYGKQKIKQTKLMQEQDRIIKINIEEEMKTSYIDYSMSVIVARALPDVRDGFKPVHRRILYGMMKAGNVSSKPYRKSAKTSEI